MGISLGDVKTGKECRPHRTLLYGTHGIGKSTFGSVAPGAIFIQIEDGLGSIDCAKFPLAKKLGDVFDAIEALYNDQHDYKTLVIDSVDWLEQLVFAEVCRTTGVDTIEDIGWGKGYKAALGTWQQLMDGLDALRNKRNMGIILLAHSDITLFRDPNNENYDRYTPSLHHIASKFIQRWADDVLFATYEVHTKTTKESFNKETVKAIGDGERVIYTVERPSHYAKNRLENAPDKIPLAYVEYAKYFPKGTVTKQKEATKKA